jgi:hypothetical protein
MMRRMPGTRAVAVSSLLAAAAAGFVAGLLGGASWAAGRTPPVAAGTVPDLEPLLAELRGLRQDLRAPAAGGAPIPAQRMDAAPAAARADAAALAAVVTDLVQAVAALTERAAILGSQQAASQGLLQQTAQRAARDPATLRDVARAVKADYDRAQADWMFTPTSELLRRLGRPNRITAGKGDAVQWIYEFEADGESWWLGVTIADGVVVRVD